MIILQDVKHFLKITFVYVCCINVLRLYLFYDVFVIFFLVLFSSLMDPVNLSTAFKTSFLLYKLSAVIFSTSTPPNGAKIELNLKNTFIWH